MKRRNVNMFFLAGSWFSFVAIMMAGSLLLPPVQNISADSPALLYRIAQHEEMRRSPGIPAGNMIVADLDGMTISLYENSVLKTSYPILSKGRTGTFWETPTGTYSVRTKEIKHFSSIGGTWMPYSMQFYGNFFIHGWPTYPDGTEVAKGYSGGCIRLSTADAKQVYEFASVGTRVTVSGTLPAERFATSSRYYLRSGTLDHESNETVKLPDISAHSFVVADVDSGTILWERGGTTTIRTGGVVSLVTALTALETVDQYKIVRMSELLLGESVLRKSETDAPDELPVGTLIYPLLFDANDTAAKVFARAHGSKQFVSYMNEKARAIGMTDTIFGGALSEDVSTSTARDLLTLLAYVDRHKHFLVDATLAPERTYVSTNGTVTYLWENKNPWLLLGTEGYRGGIGTVRSDGSGHALLLFALPLSEFGDRTIAIVIPESPSIMEDVARLRAFIPAHYIYGIEREETTFIREDGESEQSLFQKALQLLDFEQLLKEEIIYQREV